MTCSVENCTKPAAAVALCRMHYARLRRHGSVNPGNTRARSDDDTRALLRGFAGDSEDSCWLWGKSKSSPGYGVLSYQAKQMLAHRVSYMLFVGPIPDGMQIDHRCRNKSCVNPRHLEAVTPKENVNRFFDSIGRRFGLCKNGHALTGKNIMASRDGTHRCRACREAYLEKWRRNR